MQTLYAVETLEEATRAGEPVKLLQKHFEQSRQLVVYLIHCITQVARYAEKDSRQRASKHLPSSQDLSVNIKIAGNEVLWKILEHDSFSRIMKEEKLHLLDENEIFRKLYLQLAETERYQQYISVEGRDRREEKEILEFIYNDLMLPSEDFTSFIEERFTNWDDDNDMANQLVGAFLSKQQGFNFDELISKEKWDFAKGLLETVLDKKDLTLEYIKPKLKNWEADRIAILDMVLMRMGVCEFLFFETIPPKVTINEYIDLAKEYSTQQSGQFVNGILDNIHKELVKENKMHKVAFRQS